MHRVADVGRRHRIVPGQEFGIFVLPDALEVRAELVPPGGLIGEPHQRIPHVLTLDGRIAYLVPLVRNGIERVADTLVHRHMTAGREEPQPVPDDRTAEIRVEILHMLDEVPVLEAPGTEFIVVVVALPAMRRPAEKPAAREGVPAVFRNHVDPHPSRRNFRGKRAGLKDDTLRQRIVVIRLNVAIAHRAVDVHAVDLHARVAVVRSVRSHVSLFHPLRTPNIRTAQLDAGNRRAHRLHVARCREGIEHRPFEYLRPLGILHIDER